MKKKFIYIVCFFVFTLYPEKHLFSFPGDHKSFTCPEFRRVDCDKPSTQGENKPINQDCVEHSEVNDITMWGDSLTDFVDEKIYGAKPYELFLLNSDDYEIYGGEGHLVDSFDDYFTIFGETLNAPFKVQNVGIAGYDSTQMMSILKNFDYREDHIEIFDGDFVRGRVAYCRKSAPRSVVMIGANDYLHAIPFTAFLPFSAPEFRRVAIANTKDFIDWNLENGKSVLLQGNLPVKSEGVVLQDPRYINRTTLCSRDADLLVVGVGLAVLGGGFPWWLELLQGALEEIPEDFHEALTSWAFFGVEVFLKPPLEWMALLGSVNMACQNDTLENIIAPEYRNTYPDRVHINAMYDDFSANPYGKDFWTVKDTLFREFIVEEVGDLAHIGPFGYVTWAQKQAPTLKALGWNETPDPASLPEAIDGNLLGVCNRDLMKTAITKDIDAFVLGRTAEDTLIDAPNVHTLAGVLHGIRECPDEDEDGNPDVECELGCKREFNMNFLGDLRTLYQKDYDGKKPGDPGGHFSNIVYEVQGAIRDHYQNAEGGALGRLGFPVSDEECGGGALCSLARSFFECGYIEFNRLDPNPATNIFTAGTEGCRNLSEAQMNAPPDFDTCVKDVQAPCSVSLSEDIIFQLEAKSGRPPFVWGLKEGPLPPGVNLELNGRFRGPPVNVLGSWTFTVQLTDSDGRRQEHEVVFETGF